MWFSKPYPCRLFLLRECYPAQSGVFLTCNSRFPSSTSDGIVGIQIDDNGTTYSVWDDFWVIYTEHINQMA